MIVANASSLMYFFGVVNVKETEAGGLVEPPKNAETYPIPLQPLPSRTSVMVVGGVDGVWGGGVVKTIVLAVWMVVAALVVGCLLGEDELALRGGGGSGGWDHDIVVFEAGHREGGRRRRHQAVRPSLGSRGSALGRRGRPWLVSLAASH